MTPRKGSRWGAADDEVLRGCAQRWAASGAGQHFTPRERREKIAGEAAVILGRSLAGCFNRLRRLEQKSEGRHERRERRARVRARAQRNDNRERDEVQQ